MSSSMSEISTQFSTILFQGETGHQNWTLSSYIIKLDFTEKIQLMKSGESNENMILSCFWFMGWYEQSRHL